jgi:REP element-mobilizing transposase RayT
MDKPQRKIRPRLPDLVYCDPANTFLLTTCFKKNAPKLFANYAIAQACLDALVDRAAHHAVLIWAYCIMPEHVHLVMSPSPTCIVKDFMRELKSLTMHKAWKEAGYVGPSYWLRSFHDRALRSEEIAGNAMIYTVIKNPVRRGLVENWEDYPFCGSLMNAVVREREIYGG